MTDYAFIDPLTQLLTIQNQPPFGDDGTAFWTVPSGTLPSDIYVKGNSVRFYPPQPAPYYVFDIDTEAWIDARTQEDYDAYKEQVRSATSMSKYDFLKAVDQMDNDFTDEDIQMLARGEFPASVEAALAAMPPVESKDAKMRWAAMNTVGRTDALIISLGAAMGFSEFDLDDTFGIVLDPPPAP